MHEISLAQAIWGQVEAEMARLGGRLLALDVAVGAFSGADPETLEFALGLLAGRSDWPDAQVRLRTEPLALACRGCGAEFDVAGMALACPSCGSMDADPVRGTEVRLESLDVETDGAEADTSG